VSSPCGVDIVCTLRRVSGLDPILILACAGVGAGAGFLGGLLGIGGGVVIVPALLLLFDVRGLAVERAAEVAVATSLATIVFTSVSAARAQVRRGAVRWSVVRDWTPGLLVGGVMSGPVAAALPPGALPVFIGVFLLAVATIMVARWRPDPHRELPGALGSTGLGAGAGLLSGLAGIGGGNVIVPTLVWHNVPMQQASATSSTLGVPIALAGSLGFALAGYGLDVGLTGTVGFVYLPAAVAIAVVAFLCAPLGVAVAHRLPGDTLKRVFGGLLAIVAVRILWSALGA
jgi:uncharacterized membrane protein YfcA